MSSSALEALWKSLFCLYLEDPSSSTSNYVATCSFPTVKDAAGVAIAAMFSSIQLQIELLRARPTTLGEAFLLARITEARFEANAEKEQNIKEKADTTLSFLSETAMDGGGEFDDHLDEINLDLSQEFVIRVLESRDVSGGSLDGFLKWVYCKKNCEVFSVMSIWESCGSERPKVVEKTAKDGRKSGSDRGLTIWDPGIKSAFQDTTLRASGRNRSYQSRHGGGRRLGAKHIHDFDETAMLLMTEKDDDPDEVVMDGGDDGFKWGVQEASAFEELKQRKCIRQWGGAAVRRTHSYMWLAGSLFQDYNAKKIIGSQN
ncbi:hypothetical protein Tco_0237945 [Tanacetum coccineum]